jgi:hypothetical protein
MLRKFSIWRNTFFQLKYHVNALLNALSNDETLSITALPRRNKRIDCDVFSKRTKLRKMHRFKNKLDTFIHGNAFQCSSLNIFVPGLSWVVASQQSQQLVRVDLTVSNLCKGVIKFK